METIYLLKNVEAVRSALPASFPRAGSWVPNAEETETRVEFDWLAELLADLGGLIRSRKSFTMPPPFFFEFVAAVDEGSAMVMRVGDQNEVSSFNFKVRCQQVINCKSLYKLFL